MSLELGLVRLAAACPDCEPGRAARRWILDDGLAGGLVVAVLPVLATIVLVALVHAFLARGDRGAVTEMEIDDR